MINDLTKGDFLHEHWQAEELIQDLLPQIIMHLELTTLCGQVYPKFLPVRMTIQNKRGLIQHE